MIKRALILGVTGQDGALLACQLLDRGFEVFGGFRRGTSNLWRLEELEIIDKIKLVEFQLLETRGLFPVISDLKFDHIYHLAGDGFVADSFDHPSLYVQTHTLSLVDLLEVVRVASPKSKVFYASTSEIFGPATGTSSLHLDETATPNPCSPYAIAKLAGQNVVQIYRDRWSLHACSGILFNHESPFRGKQFLTRKITSSIADIVAGYQSQPMLLGDMESKKDWTAAEDITRGMIGMLESDQPHDYVLGSGRVNSVKDVLAFSCRAAGLEVIFEGSGLQQVCYEKRSGREIAVSSKTHFRHYPQIPHTANTKKALDDLGWRTEIDFEDLIVSMTKRDLERLKRRARD